MQVHEFAAQTSQANAQKSTQHAAPVVYFMHACACVCLCVSSLAAKTMEKQIKKNDRTIFSIQFMNFSFRIVHLQYFRRIVNFPLSLGVRNNNNSERAGRFFFW